MFSYGEFKAEDQVKQLKELSYFHKNSFVYSQLSLSGHLPFISHFTLTKQHLVKVLDNEHFETVNGHLRSVFFLVKNTSKKRNVDAHNTTANYNLGKLQNS